MLINFVKYAIPQALVFVFASSAMASMFETPSPGKQVSEFESYRLSADDFYQEYEPSDKNIELLSVQNLDQAESFAALIKAHHGMVIGEVHNQVAAKKLLIDSFPYMEDQATLYLEHVFFDLHQNDLDAFLSGSKAKMSRELRAHLKRLDDGHFEHFLLSNKQYKDLWNRYNFTQLVLAAKRFGIKIKAIDHSEFYQHPQFESGQNRYSSLNYFAQMQFGSINLFDEDKENIQAYNDSHTSRKRPKTQARLPIFFVGNAHIETYQGIPGIANLLSLASVSVYQHDSELHENGIEPGSFVEFTHPTISVYSDYAVVVEAAAGGK